MYPNPLMYCTCWDPWNLGPQKLAKTPHSPHKKPTGKPRLKPLSPSTEKQSYAQPVTKPVVTPKRKTYLGQEKSERLPQAQEEAQEVIHMPPGYGILRNKEQISVPRGEEMFARKKRLESDIRNKVKMSRSDIVIDLEEQISELTVIIEQMNRDHQSAQTLLTNEMELRSAEMQQSFEDKNRELKEAHAAELSELKESYQAALKAEKEAAEKKLEEMAKDYKYLKNMFHMYQDSIYDEIEDKWSKRKEEWEKDEKLEREKILLQLKRRMTKKFELQSEEEKKKINDAYTVMFQNFNREKGELLKQHENDALQLEELRKTKMIMEEELHTQSLILESLNTTLYHTQMELQREKTTVGNLEKTLQAKVAENEMFKQTIQQLTEENNHLREKLMKNEGSYE